MILSWALVSLPASAADIITNKVELNNGEWVCYRKSFNLNAKGDSIDNTLYIAADTKYWLYVNGNLVVREGMLKRGPNPSDSYLDSLSIPGLRNGKNTVAVLVCYYGRGGYSHRTTLCPGLYFDLHTSGGDIASDTTWKARKHPAFYIPSGQTPNARLPEPNVGFNARRDTIAFADSAYNDSHWNNAVAVDADSVGWGKFVVRPIPQFRNYGVKNYVDIFHTGREYRCFLPYNAQVSPILRVKAKAGKTIGIKTDCYPTRTTEYIVRFEYKTKEGEQEFEFPAWFNGHSVIYNIPDDVEVLGLAYRETGYDCDLAGSFDCNDEELNKLWLKSQRTLYLTMRDNFMDCPDRERAQYIGDVTNELAEVPYCLSPSAARLIAKCAREFADWQKPDSVLYAPVPAGDWTKELPQQSLAFCGLGLWDYYTYYGDREIIEHSLPAIRKYLKLWKPLSSGLVSYRAGNQAWGDWGKNVDLYTLNQNWYSVALDRYSRMCALTGDSAETVWADTLRRNLNAAIYSNYWKGSNFKSPSYYSMLDERSQAMSVISGAAPAEIYPTLRNLLASPDNYNASPYMERFVLQALCEMGYTQDALTRMRNRYQMMADSTLTTLWELFDLETNPTASINHAWSGAPIIILSRYVAGITPIEPLFRKFQVKPQLCDLEYLRTTVPSPLGNIKLYVSEQDGYNLKLDVPKGTQAELYLPAQYVGYHLNGKKMKGLTFSGDSLYYLTTLDAGYYNVESLLSDEDTLEVAELLDGAERRMRYLYANVAAGNELGNASTENVLNYIAAADTLLLSETDSADVYSLAFRLRDIRHANSRLEDSIAVPQGGEWYKIYARDGELPLNVLDCDTARFKLYGIWIAKGQAAPAQFSMLNAASGSEFAEFPMRLLPVADGKVAILDEFSERSLSFSPDTLPEWCRLDFDTITSQPFAFEFGKITEMSESFRDTIGPGQWKSVMLPVSIDSVSATAVSFYTVCGTQKDSSDKTAALTLAKLNTGAYSLPAGTPFVYHLAADAPQAEQFSFYTRPPTATHFKNAESNGLYGVADYTELKNSGFYVFRDGMLQKADTLAVVPPFGCYVNLSRVTEITNAFDAIIPIVNSEETDAVHNVRLQRRESYADVYTIDGVRVKKHVKISKLPASLRPGIYIVGRKKVVVK